MSESFRSTGAKAWWVALMLLASTAGFAQLKIDITSGVTDPIPIAVLPFDADPRPSSAVHRSAALIPNAYSDSGVHVRRNHC